MKYLILLFSVLFCQLFSYGQQKGFVLQLQDPGGNSYEARYAAETSAGDFLVATRVVFDETSYVKESLIMKISSEGVLLDQILLNFNDTIVSVVKLVPHPELTDRYIVFGTLKPSVTAYSNCLAIIQINANLEIISRSTVMFPNIARFGTYLHFIVNSEDDIMVAANYDPINYMQQPALYAQITTQGELKKYVRDEDYETGTLGPFFILDNEDPKKYGLWQTGKPSTGGLMPTMYELDSNLNLRLITTLPYVSIEENGTYYSLRFGLFDPTVKPYPDGTFLISAKATETWGIIGAVRDHSSILFRTGKDFVYNEDESIIFNSKNDTTEYPAYMQSIDFIDPNHIFQCSHVNVYEEEIIYSPFPSYAVINKLNTDLEVQWTRYVGGDANYAPMYLLATQDGGCLIVGFRYDFNPTRKLDLFAIKLNSEGLIGLDEEQELAQAMVAYPNPFRDRIQLLLPPNTRTVSVYNSNGMLLKTANGNCNELFLGDVPSGLYIVTAQTAEGKVYTQKVVKE